MPVLVKVAGGQKVQVGFAVQEGDTLILTIGQMETTRAAAAAAASPRPSGATPTAFPNYGRSKGAPIAGASKEDLEYYAAGARRTISDPSKSRWHDNERALLAAIEVELARQGPATSAPRARPSFMDAPATASGFDDPPPPSVDDIPF